VSYIVFRNTDRPIWNRGALQNITKICNSVLQATITSGHFLEELMPQLERVIQQLDDQGGGNEEEGRDPIQDSSNQGGNNGTMTWNPNENAADDINNNKVYLGELSLTNGTPTDEKGYRGPNDDLQEADGTNNDLGGSTYPTPLQFGDPWGTCEWLGLILFLVLVLLTSFLTYCSVWVQRRQARQQLWGTQGCLTESGVGDLLKVGWRYQQGDEQLFLQVFDKEDKLGYNDDNSMLMGGVVVGCDPTTTHTNTTAPTATLPSSTVTTTTPEQED
jgi:hypothetical protein